MPVDAQQRGGGEQEVIFGQQFCNPERNDIRLDRVCIHMCFPVIIRNFAINGVISFFSFYIFIGQLDHVLGWAEAIDFLQAESSLPQSQFNLIR